MRELIQLFELRRGSMDARVKPAHDEERRASGPKPGRSLWSRPPLPQGRRRRGFTPPRYWRSPPWTARNSAAAPRRHRRRSRNGDSNRNKALHQLTYGHFFELLICHGLRILNKMTALFRDENTAVEVHEAHAGVARIRLTTPFLNQFNHPPCRCRSDCQSCFCCLRANSQILMIKERKKCVPLVSMPSSQFIWDFSHPVVKAIEFSNSVFEQRLILFDAN